DGAEVAVRIAGQPRSGIARHRSVGWPRSRPTSAHHEVVARGDVHPPDLLEVVRPDLADVRLAHGGIIQCTLACHRGPLDCFATPFTTGESRLRRRGSQTSFRSYLGSPIQFGRPRRSRECSSSWISRASITNLAAIAQASSMFLASM